MYALLDPKWQWMREDKTYNYSGLVIEEQRFQSLRDCFNKACEMIGLPRKIQKTFMGFVDLVKPDLTSQGMA